MPLPATVRPTRYVLYTGFAYDMKRKVKQDAHASSGLAELFVLEKTDGKWAIKQHGSDEIGAWGDVPENKDWRFVQMGEQNWGYTVESGYTGQGETTTGRNFLFTNLSRIYLPAFSTAKCACGRNSSAI